MKDGKWWFPCVCSASPPEYAVGPVEEKVGGEKSTNRKAEKIFMKFLNMQNIN